MNRILRVSLLVLLILTHVLVLLLITACQSELAPVPSASPTEQEPVPPTSPTEQEPAPPVSPPEVQGDIILLSSTAVTEYPSAISFTVEAESAAEITEAVLEYKIDKITTVVLTTRIMADFVTATRVKAISKLEMKKLGGLPPGAEIMYHWKPGSSRDASCRHRSPATEAGEDIHLRKQ